MTQYVLSNAQKQAPTSPAKFRGQTLLFVVNDASFFISHRLILARAAREAGLRVLVATPLDDGVARVVAEGFEHHPISLCRWSMSARQELLALYDLWKLYSRLRPDLVHHVTIKPVLYGSIAARLAGVSAVVNAVSGLGFVFISRGVRATLRRIIVKQLYRFAFGHKNLKVIFQNNDDRSEFISQNLVREEQCCLVRGSGADPIKYRPSTLTTNELIVVMPSRLIWDKGVGEFVAAATELKRGEFGHVRFAIAGEPDPNNPAGIPLEQIADWERSGEVEFWGRCSEMEKVYAKAAIVCLPSYREGLPKALIEAAAAGKAIITSDCPGCREIVQHNVNGLLVPVRDQNALREALASLLRNKALREACGAAGRQLFEEGGFSEEAVRKSTMDIYEALLPEVAVSKI